MKKLSLLVVLCACFIFVGSAVALPVVEILGNNSYDNPMDLDSYFSVGTNPEIHGSDQGFSWVSVQSSGEAGTHYFSFNALATDYVFDIDHGWGGTGSTDIEMGIWNGITGQLLAWNDDHYPVDTGSNSVLDSWIQLTFAEPTYVIVGLAEFSSNGGPDGFISGNLLDAGDSYVLNISGNYTPPAPVPEPATMLLLGTGLAGMIGIRRKKISFEA